MCEQGRYHTEKPVFAIPQIQIISGKLFFINRDSLQIKFLIGITVLCQETIKHNAFAIRKNCEQNICDKCFTFIGIFGLSLCYNLIFL